MAKGAGARSGPAPDPHALRRERDSGEWTTLPAEGRKGRTPKWPLIEPSDRELELWRREWRRPQAIMWQRLGLEVEVALYVRRLVRAEVPGASVNLGTLVRQMQEALGLSLPGLHRNRWRIAADEVREKRETPKTQSSRDRFQVVAGEGGG